MANELAALEARLGRLEDLDAVRSTWLDYCTRLDLGDVDGLRDVFTETAQLEVNGLAEAFDGVYHGRDSILNDMYLRTGFPMRAGAQPRNMTGHLSTNMQIDLDGDLATTLAYFFEIVDDLVLIGTYQHRMRRDPDRWRIAFLRISIRYRARIEAHDVAGQALATIAAKPT